jgi:hypothetical protein
MASIFVKLSFAGSVAIVDVEALTTGAVGCLGFVLHFSLSFLSWLMVTVVGYYNPRMASREIGDVLNDEIGA